jgi:hypothetical protein
MKDEYDLSSRTFLRSLKDAQFCLYLNVYKNQMISQFNQDSEAVLNAYLDSSSNRDYKLLESYKKFQFSGYVLTKLGLDKGGQPYSSFEKAMETLRNYEKNLDNFDSNIRDIK